MKKYLAVGYPDEENIYFHSHTSAEEWTLYAENDSEAMKKAFDHFYYFHEVSVNEIEEKKVEKPVCKNEKKVYNINNKREVNNNMNLNVKSSWVKSINKVGKDLIIECENGNVYLYLDVDAETMLGLLDAESVGHYINEHIKGKFECFKKLVY